MTDVLDKRCGENQNTHFVFSNIFENLAIYEKLWKNIVARGKPQMTLCCKFLACWMPRATNTHNQVV